MRQPPPAPEPERWQRRRAAEFGERQLGPAPAPEPAPEPAPARELALQLELPPALARAPAPRPPRPWAAPPCLLHPVLEGSPRQLLHQLVAQRARRAVRRQRQQREPRRLSPRSRRRCPVRQQPQLPKRPLACRPLGSPPRPFLCAIGDPRARSGWSTVRRGREPRSTASGSYFACLLTTWRDKKHGVLVVRAPCTGKSTTGIPCRKRKATMSASCVGGRGEQNGRTWNLVLERTRRLVNRHEADAPTDDQPSGAGMQLACFDDSTPPFRRGRCMRCLRGICSCSCGRCSGSICTVRSY